MPLSSHLAPGFIRITYSGTGRPHHQIIPIKFNGTPEPGVDPSLETTSGGFIQFSTAVVDWITVFKANFNATTAFGLAEIYAVDQDTGIRTFIYATNIADVGSDVDPQVPFVEGVWTFKTTAGRPLKVYCMEGVYAADARNVGNVPNDGRQDVVDYITGDDNIFYGRTDAWPLALLAFTSKVNDVLRANGAFSDV